MPSFILPAVACLLGAPSAAPAFTEVWYKEVFDGSLASAANEYQTIYLSPPSERVRQEVRRKAAYRAAVCFEKLGLIPNARAAYTAVLDLEPGEEVPPARARDPLSSDALRRLKALVERPEGAEKGAEPPGPSAHALPPGPVEASLDVAVEGAIDTLRAAAETRTRALAALERTTVSHRESLSAREALRSRLAARGVDVCLRSESPGAALPADLVLSVLREALVSEADLPHLLGSLAERAAARALARFEAADRFAAARETQLAAAFSGAGLPPPAAGRALSAGRAAWLLGLTQSNHDASRLATLARRRRLQEAIERKGAAVRELQALLDQAAEAEARGRIDQAVAPLEKARELTDWMEAGLRDDPEILLLRSRTARRYLLLAKSRAQEDALVQLWVQARGQVALLIERAEEVAYVVARELRLRGPVASEGRWNAEPACRSEAQQLLCKAREALAKGDALRARRALQEVVFLREWVPAAIPAQTSRPVMEALEKEGGAAPGPPPSVKE